MDYIHYKVNCLHADFLMVNLAAFDASNNPDRNLLYLVFRELKKVLLQALNHQGHIPMNFHHLFCCVLSFVCDKVFYVVIELKAKLGDYLHIVGL